MRFSGLVVAALAACFVAGCASSVSPLYTTSDAVSDPAVVGTWLGGDKNDQSTVRIAANRNGSYEVTVHDLKSGDDSIYSAHLVNLGGKSFADLLLTDYRRAGQSADLPFGAVALHEIVQYQLKGEDLSVSAIDADALGKASEQPGFPLQIRATRENAGSETNGDTIILSNTGDLRRYFSAHPSDIFGKPTVLHRQP